MFCVVFKHVLTQFGFANTFCFPRHLASNGNNCCSSTNLRRRYMSLASRLAISWWRLSPISWKRKIYFTHRGTLRRMLAWTTQKTWNFTSATNTQVSLAFNTLPSIECNGKLLLVNKCLLLSYRDGAVYNFWRAVEHVSFCYPITDGASIYIKIIIGYLQIRMGSSSVAVRYSSLSN